LRKSRDTIATPTSMVWTSPETNSVSWSRNGTLLLKHSFKLRHLMGTCSECFALDSQEEQASKSKLLAIPQILRAEPSVRE